MDLAPTGDAALRPPRFAWRPARVSARTLARVALVVIVTFVVLALRRPDQLVHPYMWDEDGTINLPHYVASGWSSVFLPLCGYFVIPAKLIFAVATKISFLHQPTVAYWLTVGFTCAVVGCVVFAPTTLRWPWPCALAVLLVPSDPEVFAVPLYAFWWGTLLCVIPLFWRESATPQVFPRMSMVALGGLSSPMIVGVSVLYLARYARRRTRSELYVLATAMLTAAAQVMALKATHAADTALGTSNWMVTGAVMMLGKFFGFFMFLAPDWFAIVTGALLVSFVGLVAVRFRERLVFEDLLLLGCLAAAIYASCQRQPLEVIHPVHAGPRYFFFPYVFLSWILLQIAAVTGIGPRLVVAAVLLLALRQTAEHGRRLHFPFHWPTEARACARSELYRFPVHFDGRRLSTWHVYLSGAECQALISGSLVDHLLEDRE